jgi:hypothetical protein
VAISFDVPEPGCAANVRRRSLADHACEATVLAPVLLGLSGSESGGLVAA